MFKGGYKTIAGFLVIMILCSSGWTSVQAKTTNSTKEDSEVVQVKFTNIYAFINNFEISDSGKSTFTSIVTARNVDKVSISCAIYNSIQTVSGKLLKAGQANTKAQIADCQAVGMLPVDILTD